MTAIDFRDATWSGLRLGLEARRGEAYLAWVRFGPGTTRAVAEKAGMDILMFRPRTTELVQMGLLRVASHVEHNGKEGVYRVTGEEEWERWREDRVEGQMQLI